MRSHAFTKKGPCVHSPREEKPRKVSCKASRSHACRSNRCPLFTSFSASMRALSVLNSVIVDVSGLEREDVKSEPFATHGTFVRDADLWHAVIRDRTSTR